MELYLDLVMGTSSKQELGYKFWIISKESLLIHFQEVSLLCPLWVGKSIAKRLLLQIAKSDYSITLDDS
jgi:hypothetical protein